MNFRIANPFTTGLAKLTGEEQKQVKTTAFDLQMSPTNPGMSFHKLNKAKDIDISTIELSRIRVAVTSAPQPNPTVCP